MNLTPQEIADEIIKSLKESHHTFWIDPETHSSQHDFIALLLKEREEKEASKQRIKEKLAGSVILSFILAVIGLIGMGALEWIRNHLK